MSRTTSKQIATAPVTAPDPASVMTIEEQARRYRALVKSHRQLEARLREEQRLAEWWKERVGALDKRCRDVNTELRVALDQKRALMKTVRFLKTEVGHLWRCRLVEANQIKDTSADLDAFLQAAEKELGVAKASWALDKWRGEENEDPDRHLTSLKGTEEAQTDSQAKDPAIKALIQTLWSVQSEDSIISEKSSVCECDSSRTLKALFPRSDEKARAIEEEQPDPLTEMLLRRRSRKGRSGNGTAEEMRVTTPIAVDQAPAIPTVVRTPVNSSNIQKSTRGSASRQLGASPVTASPATTSSITASPPVTDSPITPFVEAQTPEALSKARKEHKQALRMKLKATREKVEGIRRENGVLEGLLIADRTDGTRG
ncbi:uncharacterized protein H6S33_009350 [Morchella sextelata]|jgi:hypothetical protein|uniref:uncharacterized protein n=1 Tax=Morchella sextelata TaxID=1174677 RepID=UPI001D046EE4|nr:uncharacterized protein H6S33_009350 [Morchella sextelata]KAH0612970.1 hypothetical protein H6S33_009350 [Morchella sextelata]